MKQMLKSTAGKKELILDRKNENVNENYLYYLLFAGKITLKEYLKQLNEKDRQSQAA